MSRRQEIAVGVADVRRRIEAGCTAVGRDPATVTLVAVAKTFPTMDIRILADLGVTEIGENRDQEARAKAAELADLALRWHFVGRLQRNKSRSVARYAAVVHSLDRPELVSGLDAAAGAAGRRVTGLVQVALADAAGRGGVPPAGVLALAGRVAAAEHLELGGVMAVAPLGADPGPAFARLADSAAEVRAAHPDAVIISAGMSSDLEAALAHGATHVRVGSAVFGVRPDSLR